MEQATKIDTWVRHIRVINLLKKTQNKIFQPKIIKPN